MDYKDFKHYFFQRTSVRTAKTSEKGFPIYVRFIYQGLRKEYSTHVHGDPELWNNAFKRFEPISLKDKANNKKLDELEKKIEHTYWEVCKTCGEFIIEEFFDLFFGRNDRHLVLSVFDMRIKEIEKLLGNGFEKSTLTIYKVTKKHLAKYFKTIDEIDISLKRFKVGHVRGFYEFLRKTMSNNSANKYMRKLRAIINFALDNEWVDSNVCSGFKLKDKQVPREALSKDELKRLSTKVFEINRLEVIRDLFVFQCYTGLAFSDMKELREGNIKVENKNRFIVKPRKKTQAESIIPLLPEADDIISKYSRIENDGILLPVPSNQRMNAYLKEIATICRIDKDLTTHLGRHTFATLTLNKGLGMDYLQSIMGMTSTKHLMIYAKMNKQTLATQMQSIGCLYK